MNGPNRNVRLLCLLALGQLVVGPLVLVLVQATTLCRLTVREAPVHGMAAVSRAWQSEEFQSALVRSADVVAGRSKPSLPGRESKAKPGKVKITATPWQSLPVPPVEESRAEQWAHTPDAWTPAWPHAPPGPPPRVA